MRNNFKNKVFASKYFAWLTNWNAENPPPDPGPTTERSSGYSLPSWRGNVLWAWLRRLGRWPSQKEAASYYAELRNETRDSTVHKKDERTSQARDEDQLRLLQGPML